LYTTHSMLADLLVQPALKVAYGTRIAGQL
jgi:hypothetical protein